MTGAVSALVVAGSCTPTPALLRLMAPSPRKIAMVVTTLEEDDGAQSQPADLPQVGVSGDADHQRPEQQRRDDGLDQPQKDERQHAQVGGDVGEVVSDLRAQQHGDEDPRGERAAQAAIDDQRGQRDPAQSGKQQ